MRMIGKWLYELCDFDVKTNKKHIYNIHFICETKMRLI